MKTFNCKKCGIKVFNVDENYSEDTLCSECQEPNQRESFANPEYYAQREKEYIDAVNNPKLPAIGRWLAKKSLEAMPKFAEKAKASKVKLKRLVSAPRFINTAKKGGKFVITFNNPLLLIGPLLGLLFITPFYFVLWPKIDNAINSNQLWRDSGMLMNVAFLLFITLICIWKMFEQNAIVIAGKNLLLETRILGFAIKKITFNNISQLYCTKEIRGSGSTNDIKYLTYTLKMILSNGKKHELFSTLNYETVRYLEQEIERVMGITDTEIQEEA